jgi:hypothetical protein
MTVPSRFPSMLFGPEYGNDFSVKIAAFVTKKG